MGSHTPGPWDLTEDHYLDVAFQVFRSQHAPVETWRDVRNAKKNADEEIEANARLMAHAPELVEVAALARDLMETIAQNVELDEYEQQLLDKARAALRKAGV